MNRLSKNQKKENSKINIFLKIIAIIFVIITLVFCTTILKLNLLPVKYITIFVIVEAVLTALLLIGLAKQHKTLKLNIFCLIIAIIISSIYIYATNYANATIKFLNSIFNEVVETEEYYVVVLKNSNYNQIEDLNDKEMYLFQVEDDVRTDIESKATVSLNAKPSLTELGTDLINENIESILISSSQYSMLEEEIKNFKSVTKIIYVATHKIQKQTAIEDENAKYSVENKSFNIYVSGIDTSGTINNVSRSDANIVVTVNTKTHEILITSIPRDYYVTLHSKNSKDKLTHSGIYGISETITTVEDLLETDINYYVRVNFTTVIKLVDELGGIDVYSEYDFSSNGYNFKKGYNHVDGNAALVFSRERYSFYEGDNQRIKNQQQVIEAILKKVTNSKTILTKYTSILNSLEGSFQTNIDQDDISQIVKEQLDTMASWTIKTNSLKGTDAYKSTYSMGSQELYVMIPDTDSVEEATKKINEILEK